MTARAFVFLAAALLWSLIALGLGQVLADGGASLVAFGRWLELEPASTQWVTDSLAEAGRPARGLVLLIWGLGLLVLLLLALLAGGRSRT
jgi:hypothetical protein